MATKEVKAGSVLIMECDCLDVYQDSKYGPRKRVHNVGRGDASCTKCSKKRGHAFKVTGLGKKK